MENDTSSELMLEGSCLRCLRELTHPEITLAAQDDLQYCTVCREAVASLRTAIRKAMNGKFRTGV